MPNSLLFKAIGRIIDSLAVVLDSLRWWTGMLGPHGNPVECVAEVLAVPPLFLQESGHSSGILVDSGIYTGMLNGVPRNGQE